MAKKRSTKNAQKNKVTCKIKGCRRIVSDEMSGLCAKCKETDTATTTPEILDLENIEAVSPMDEVERLTEFEVMKFRALEAEIRVSVLGVQTIDGKLINLSHTYKAEQNRLQNDKNQIINERQVQQAEYKSFICAICAQRELDPLKIAIDPDTRVVRDLREEGNG